MDVEHTPAVILAIERARLLARAAEADRVQPRHLLQGLVQEEEGRASGLLAEAGVEVSRIRGLLPAVAGDPAQDAQPLFSAEVEAIVMEARELGRLLSAEHTVTSEQVLLCVLRQDADLRGELAALGLDFEALEKKVMGDQTPLELDEPLDLGESREQVPLARLLDAAANRAREGLRVLEDYCRFVLNDALLTREWKQLRHALAQALGHVPADLLLASRDTPGDVGTEISTAREHERDSFAAVVQANAKRAQEALRSLEEYGKCVSADFGQAVESLRYRVYTLERVVWRGTNAHARLAEVRLDVLVTEAECRLSLPGTIAEAAAGGAQAIQLREKNLEDRTLLARAREVRRLTRNAGVLFIMNDRPDLALLAQADGVHLGQEDLPVSAARRILGPHALIGVSTHDLDQVRRAVLDGADYIGIGPTFPSQTKSFATFPGLDFVRQATAETSLPAFVIGGVTLDNLPAVAAAGGKRVAVSRAICQADDPRGGDGVAERAGGAAVRIEGAREWLKKLE